MLPSSIAPSSCGAACKIQSKAKGVPTTAAITFATVRNALWIDVSLSWYFVCPGFPVLSVLLAICKFAAFWSLKLLCLQYLQQIVGPCRLKVWFLFRTFACKSDSHLETGRAIESVAWNLQDQTPKVLLGL